MFLSLVGWRIKKKKKHVMPNNLSKREWCVVSYWDILRRFIYLCFKDRKIHTKNGPFTRKSLNALLLVIRSHTY